MQQETREVIVITWTSGVKQVFDKVQHTYDIIVNEFDDIEDVEYVDFVTYTNEVRS